jgi:hypothetical protein
MINRLSQPRNRIGPGRHRRGVALMLVMVAVIVSGTVAYTYLGSQSTSIGIANNIRNSSKARYVADSGMEVAMAAIRSNTNWRTQRPNGTWITDQSLAGGTFTINGEDGYDLDGDGDVDGDGNLTDDGSDLLTLTVTGKANGCAHVWRGVVTPIPGDSTLFVYGFKNDPQPFYRKWTGSTWGSSSKATDMGGKEPHWLVARQCPTRTEIATCILDKDIDINIQFYDGSSWSAVTELTSNAVTGTERCVDIAYEQLSGDLLIAYRTSSSTPLRFRTYSGTSVSSESSYTLPSTGGLKWVKMVPKPNSNEILLVTLDANNDVSTAIWNGSSWTNALLLETTATSSGDEGISAAYEGQSGEGIVAWSASGVMTVQYRTWNGSAWSAEANAPTLGTGEPRWVHMASDPAGNKVIMGTCDVNKDIYLTVWNGASWGTPLLAESNTPDANSREFDIAFEKGGTEALALWGRSSQSKFFYRTWSGSAWSTEQTGPNMADVVKLVQAIPGLVPGQVLVSILNRTLSGQVEGFLWNGSAFSQLGIIDSSISGTNTQEAFMVAPPLESSGTGGYTYTVDLR